MRRVALAGFLIVCLAVARADDPDVEGRWRVHVVRDDGWQPRDVFGDLTLARDGAGWKATLRLEVVFAGEPLEVVSTKVAGDRVRVKAKHSGSTHAVDFDGRLAAGQLSGRVVWTGAEGGAKSYSWTGRRSGASLLRIDEEPLPLAQDLARVDSAALAALIERAEEARSGGLVVLLDGKVLIDRSFQRERRAENIQSITKAVTTLALLLLHDDGKLPTFDVPASTWYDEWKKDERKAKITLRHLLTHTSGIETSTDLLQKGDVDMLAVASARPAVFEPGTRYMYSNCGLLLVSGIIQKLAGRPVDDYLRDRLFAPLGIHRVWWMHDGRGTTCTYGGLQLEAIDLAKIGQLVLQQGEWNGRQLIARESVKLLWQPSSVESWEQVGLGWFLIRDWERARCTFTDETLDALGEAGGPKKELASLSGKSFVGTTALHRALDATLSPNARRAYDQAVQRMDRLPFAVDGDFIGIGHSGSLGQFLYVFPDRGLVGVRTYFGESEEEYGNTGFGDFAYVLSKVAKPR